MRIKDDNEIKNILKIVSPGTYLREGLENILRAKTGGLIVLGAFVRLDFFHENFE